MIDSVICIHTFNRLNYTKQTLNSIFDNTTQRYKIVVVDDVSTDGTIEYLTELQKQGKIDFVKKESHTGRQHSFALKRYHGYKSGLKYIIMLDNDTPAMVKGWLTEFIDAYENLKKNWKGKTIPILCGLNIGEKSYGEKMEIGGKRYARAPWLGGGGWLIEHDILDKIGWDELEPVHIESRFMHGQQMVKNAKGESVGWICDADYRDRAVARGFEHTFVYIKIPSLLDHIGLNGVHCKTNHIHRGDGWGVTNL